jgi:hypothetical protein
VPLVQLINLITVSHGLLLFQAYDLGLGGSAGIVVQDGTSKNK